MCLLCPQPRPPGRHTVILSGCHERPRLTISQPAPRQGLLSTHARPRRLSRYRLSTPKTSRPLASHLFNSATRTITAVRNHARRSVRERILRTNRATLCLTVDSTDNKRDRNGIHARPGQSVSFPVSQAGRTQGTVSSLPAVVREKRRGASAAVWSSTLHTPGGFCELCLVYSGVFWCNTAGTADSQASEKSSESVPKRSYA